MKKIKIFALALNVCLVLGAFAGCTKQEEASVSILESTTASATEVSSSSEETETTSGNFEYIILDADGQKYANTFMSNFAEQLFTGDRDSTTVEQYMRFVRLHLKINSYKSITYETYGEITYETFTWEKAQSVISKYFGIFLEYGYEDLPEPPQNHDEVVVAVGPYYKDGRIWFEASDGEIYNDFAVVDSVENYYDGSLTLRFTIYEIDLRTFADIDDDGLRAYYTLTPDEAKADDTLTAYATGTAVVDVGQSGEYYLISCHAERV